MTENAVESRFALGNELLGMRASRPVSRGPTWVSWLGYIRWCVGPHLKSHKLPLLEMSLCAKQT